MIPHLQQVLGEEKFSLILPTSTLGNTATNQRMAAFAAGGGIRQGGTVSGIPPGQIPLQFQAQVLSKIFFLANSTVLRE